MTVPHPSCSLPYPSPQAFLLSPLPVYPAVTHPSKAYNSLPFSMHENSRFFIHGIPGVGMTWTTMVLEWKMIPLFVSLICSFICLSSFHLFTFYSCIYLQYPVYLIFSLYFHPVFAPPLPPWPDYLVRSRTWGGLVPLEQSRSIRKLLGRAHLIFPYPDFHGGAGVETTVQGTGDGGRRTEEDRGGTSWW